MEVVWDLIEIEPRVYYLKWCAISECAEDDDFVKEISKEIDLDISNQFYPKGRGKIVY